MKKAILTFALLVMGTTVFSQKMITRNGKIIFEATTKGFEEIKATTNTASGILDQSTGEFVALALVKSFKFKVPLMEEHFNENYIESSKFPKATFKGKLLNYDAKKVTSKGTSFDLEGDLTMHGVTKKIKTKMTMVSNAGKISASTSFNTTPQNFDIQIPSLVKDKIAKEIIISVDFLLEAQQNQ